MHAEENQAVLHNMDWLDLGSLKLTCVPLEVGLCRGLTGLCLYNNELPTLPPGLFGEMTALQGLFIWNNQIASLPNRAFQGLSSLRELAMETNQLSILSAETFQGLTALQEINLSANRLSTLPDGTFEGLTNLQKLDLASNQLRFLPERLFRGLTALRRLYLYKNQLCSLSEGLFLELPALQELSLSQNRLSFLPPGIFQELGALQKLRLSDNQLSTLPPGIFHGLPLLNLSLVNNQLVSLPRGIFHGMSPQLLLIFHGNHGLLHVYGNLDDFYTLTLLKEIDTFFDYACRSPWAQFYQFAGDNFSREALQEAFLQLPDPLKNALYEKVWEVAGCPETSDPRQWGSTHAFDEMQIFYKALKKHMKDSFEALDDTRKNAVYFHVHKLASSDSVPAGTDFNSPNWGKEHALTHVPRLIDAMTAALESP
jgi:Leucine-rich repeat (LRR) protein